MALPDFIIIGAMKCGTSTLQAQLMAQDDVFMTTPKEPNYFSDDAIYGRGTAWYESLFEAAAPGDLRGEASTHYTKLPTYPATVQRMAATLERPRFIYLVRDSVDRAISHYLHEWTVGAVGDDIAAAFAARPDFVEYGRYAMQIAPYVEQFGAGSVLVVRAERMRADPQGTLERIGAFLGRNGFRWRPDLAARNVSAERSRPLPLHGVLVDNPVAATIRRAFVPKRVRTWIRQSRMPRQRPALPDDLERPLRSVFDADATALAALLPPSQIVE
ncbi:sulfotransferase [Rhodovulum sp. 12E13]|uniref:sulfotransferase family protein n=1 Tax=Rhodovulum sp. 12E13 TaxID=2203891 RepID=UPI000E192741|nr:sulfotransferase [Rhodovulum sp. 12E13]RDC73751.1 sulfotransferase [Rhodovulum sp. 12E13]